ncbi:TonB-dependent siderophore receptor [Phormidium tenue FACHB-886]|nr:TonB-dependent siderophore receptor [Phormidium tenue FACHB-886]
MWLAAIASIITIQPVWADVGASEDERRVAQEQSAAVNEWLTEMAQVSIVEVTEVRLNSTDAGLEIILVTQNGQLPLPTPSAVGNALIADIPGAVLALPDGDDFLAAEPAEGVALISVTNLPESRIRVAITGTEAPPTAEVRTTAQGLVLSVAEGSERAERAERVEGSEEDALQVVVTGEQNDDYFIPDASTATRTDTPILDIPQSVQVIPQQVLEDQQVTRLDEALENAAGVVYGGTDTFGDVNYSIRGFSGAPVLQDGFRQYDFVEIPEVANIERIEILRGPAEILYGEIQPGGVINLVTERSLPDPFYEAQVQLGSYGLVRPQIDISGPLNDSESLLYRLNAVYSRQDGFRDFDQAFEQFFIAPVLTWEISDRTDLTLDLQLLNREQPYDFGTVAFGNGVLDTPRDRIFNEPDDYLERDFFSIRLALDHEFSDSWSIRSAFRFTDSSTFSDRISVPTAFNEDTGNLTRAFALDDFDSQNYALQTNVVGEFLTGSVGHTLLFGVDLTRTSTSRFGLANFTPSIINVFDPEYGADRSELNTLLFDRLSEIDRLGIYLQDQIDIFDNLILVAGLRYESVEQRINNVPALFYSGGGLTQYDDALTPQVGIVYQPIENLSLYASYSQSFTPNVDEVAADGNPLEPERGEGFEVGVKAELFDNLLVTLAYFDITKQNVATQDPNFPGLNVSVATGEQQSQGIEFDVVGEILPGWDIIASYAYTDAEVTEDNTISIGNRLAGIPRHNASLWTTYQIQDGNLQGLGFGIGFQYIGERQGDLANTFETDDYFLTNAAVFYERDDWRLALNFRNLFDINYISSTPSFGSRTSGGFPGEPFTVVGSISVRF